MTCACKTKDRSPSKLLQITKGKSLWKISTR